MGKIRVVAKFAAACVGSGVATGIKVYRFGAACGREIVGMSKSRLSSLTGKVIGNVPRSIRGEGGERDEMTLRPSGTPNQPTPQRAGGTQEPRPPRARPEKQPPAPKSPRRRDKPRAEKSVAPKPKSDRRKTAAGKAARAVPRSIQMETLKALQPSGTQIQPTSRPAARAFTSELDDESEALRCTREEDNDDRDRLLAKQGEALARIRGELKRTRDLVQEFSDETNPSKE